MLENTESVFAQTLLFGNRSLNIADNTKIVNAAKIFILLAKRFDEPFFKTNSVWLFFCVSYGIYFSLFCMDDNNILEY